jgi:hypothetical protein
MGFEPTTSSMPSRRAPNCATAPPPVTLVLVYHTLAALRPRALFPRAIFPQNRFLEYFASKFLAKLLRLLLGRAKSFAQVMPSPREANRKI